MKKKIEINYELISLQDADEEIRSLINAAEQALLASHAPYSGFHVGAALLLENGEVIKGSNQENAAFPLGFCAERTALAAKFGQSPGQKIESIAIAILSKTGEIMTPIAPCGMCRQALLEEENKQGRKIKTYLSGNDGNVMIISSIGELLPFQFDSSVFTD